MSTLEEFENAPVGATATGPNGSIAFKTGRRKFEWSMYDSRGSHLDNHHSAEMVSFTLNPTAPTTSREALDLAWNLAHEVKEGQRIPEGTRLLERSGRNDLSAYTTLESITINAREALSIRTLDPMPDPEPGWLDAPAILATDDRDRRGIFFPVADRDEYWQSAQTGLHYHWSYLTDVTPLYPKGQDK